MVLRKAGVAKSTYYRNRSLPRIDRYSDVRPLIREIFTRTPNGMGYRQVRLAILHKQGLCISGKTVLKLMHEEGLRCRIRRKRYNSYVGPVGKSAPNILNREFEATRPMEKLATDVTEFAVAGGKAYLSPVMDLYNNEIVAWSISKSPNYSQINEMLDMLQPKVLAPALLHSDQGWQYQMLQYQRRIEEMGITQSMSRKATCLDNACMEGFFGHLKDEFYRGQSFATYEEFKRGLDDYIRYWNAGRYQVGLKGMTPVQYRGHSIRAA